MDADKEKLTPTELLESIEAMIEGYRMRLHGEGRNDAVDALGEVLTKLEQLYDDVAEVCEGCTDRMCDCGGPGVASAAPSPAQAVGGEPNVAWEAFELGCEFWRFIYSQHCFDGRDLARFFGSSGHPAWSEEAGRLYMQRTTSTTPKDDGIVIAKRCLREALASVTPRSAPEAGERPATDYHAEFCEWLKAKYPNGLYADAETAPKEEQ